MTQAKKSTRIKAPAVAAPRTREQAEALLEQIGIAQRKVARIEADMNDALTTIKTASEQAAAPHNAEIEGNCKALHAWAEAHRDELCAKGKTARLASGELSWRQRPPSVRITGTDKVIDALKKLDLTRFLREKIAVDKDAILAEPQAVEHVKGVSITRGVEDFVAKPYESEIERAEPVLRQVKA